MADALDQKGLDEEIARILIHEAGGKFGWETAYKLARKINERLSASQAETRRLALEEAAKVAEREGVYPELNVFGGGPEWYQHGKRISTAIRALIDQPSTEGGKDG